MYVQAYNGKILEIKSDWFVIKKQINDCLSNLNPIIRATNDGLNWDYRQAIVLRQSLFPNLRNNFNQKVVFVMTALQTLPNVGKWKGVRLVGK